MSHIPLIFTRPFQSSHCSLRNIAHTCPYASLYPLDYVDRHVQLSKGAPVFPLFCSMGFERQVHCWCPCVQHREGHLSVFVSTNNGQLSSQSSSLRANVLHVRNKRWLFQVVRGITGCRAALGILLEKVNCCSMSTLPLHLINLVYCTDHWQAGVDLSDPSR